MLLRRLARPLLATAFVADGVDTLVHPQPRAKAAAALVQQGERSLPENIAAKLPADPGTIVRINAIVQVSAGVLLAIGKMPRLASCALAATVIPATVTEQDFWAEQDPDRKAAKRNAFLKDVSLLGGLIIAAADTEGKPSLGWRGRRAAGGAAAAVSAALPFGASSGSPKAEALREHAHDAAVRARTFGGIAATKATAVAETAQERGAELAETAKEHGPEWAELAKHRGVEFAEMARRRSAELAELAKDRGPGYAELAKRRSAELAELAKHRGPEYAELAKRRSAELAELAKHRRPEYAELAKRRGAEIAELAKERGPELASTAKDRGAHLTERARVRAEARRG